MVRLLVLRRLVCRFLWLSLLLRTIALSAGWLAEGEARRLTG
jgi:hypothetical protein